jgi:hypothetical protein
MERIRVLKLRVAFCRVELRRVGWEEDALLRFDGSPYGQSSRRNASSSRITRSLIRTTSSSMDRPDGVDCIDPYSIDIKSRNTRPLAAPHDYAIPARFTERFGSLRRQHGSRLRNRGCHGGEPQQGYSCGRACVHTCVSIGIDVPRGRHMSEVGVVLLKCNLLVVAKLG